MRQTLFTYPKGDQIESRTLFSYFIDCDRSLFEPGVYFCRHFCDSISWAIVSRQVNFYQFLLDIIDFVLFPYHLKPEFYSTQDYIKMTLFWNMIVFESGLYSSEVYYYAYLSLLHRSGLDLYKCLLCPTTK